MKTFLTTNKIISTLAIISGVSVAWGFLNWQGSGSGELYGGQLATGSFEYLIASLIIAILLYLAVIISVVLKLARWYMLLLPIFGLLGVWLFMRFGSLLN